MKINTFLSFIPVFLVIALKAQSPTPNAQKGLNTTPVQTESGLVNGFYNERTSVTVFRGIPFASPPIGKLRWKAPQPATTWKGVKNCLTFGPSPMQPKPVPFLMIGPEFVVPQQPLSEDCLYLNIWTAAQSSR